LPICESFSRHAEKNSDLLGDTRVDFHTQATNRLFVTRKYKGNLMNKAQFIAALAPHFGNNKKEAARAVDIVFDTITRNISKGEDVMINDFGKFKKVDRPARKGRNPFTGETIQIKASKKVRFLPAKSLKEIVTGARKMDPAPKPPVMAPAKPAKVAKPAAKKAVKKVTKKAAPKKAAKKVAKKPAAKKPAKKAAKKK
jgi:DNA-binding protein HU-beta